MLKQSITGRLIGITEEHYITQDGQSIKKWHKQYYRIERSADELNLDILNHESESETNVPSKTAEAPIKNWAKKLSSFIFKNHSNENTVIQKNATR